MFDLVASVLALFYAVVHSYGLSIALLTLTVVSLLFPLTLRQVRAAAAMRRHAPELQRLRAAHADDPANRNQAVASYLREQGVHPASGCLPMLVQLPVWFVLYQVISGLTRRVDGDFSPRHLDHDTELYRSLASAGGRMLWCGLDLARSATNVLADGVGGGLPYLALLVVMGATQWAHLHRVQASQSHGAPTSASDDRGAGAPEDVQVAVERQLRRFTRLSPFVFPVISLGFPAALVLYWTVSNVLRLVQHEIVSRIV